MQYRAYGHGLCSWIAPDPARSGQMPVIKQPSAAITWDRRHPSDYRVGQAIIRAIVARSTETLGDQTHGSRGGISTREPTHLARRQRQGGQRP
jgi:hypothetical protein